MNPPLHGASDTTQAPVAVAEHGADLDSFSAARLAEGFDEVVERVWPAGTVVPTHGHPFAVAARVVQGDMWLTIGGETRHLRPGDCFELACDVPHAERYGDAGATYWAARRHA